MFFNDTATTEIYTLALHDALPIYYDRRERRAADAAPGGALRRPVQRLRQRGGRGAQVRGAAPALDRKSTRLNSSHANTSYAVFCLTKNISVTLPSRLPMLPPLVTS